MDLHEKALEHGLKFGVVMRKALTEQLSIEGEKELLRGRIDAHLKAAEELDEKIKLLERAKSRVDNEVWDEVVDALKEQVDREQTRLIDNPYDSVKIRENQLMFYAHKARMTRTELLTFIEEELVGGPILVV